MLKILVFISVTRRYEFMSINSFGINLWPFFDNVQSDILVHAKKGVRLACLRRFYQLMLEKAIGQFFAIFGLKVTQILQKNYAVNILFFWFEEDNFFPWLDSSSFNFIISIISHWSLNSSCIKSELQVVSKEDKLQGESLLRVFPKRIQSTEHWYNSENFIRVGVEGSFFPVSNSLKCPDDMPINSFTLVGVILNSVRFSRNLIPIMLSMWPPISWHRKRKPNLKRELTN